MDFKIDNNSLEEYKNFISKFYKMDIYNVREYNSIELIEGMGENLLYSILNFNLDVLVEGYLGSFNQYKGDYSFNSYLVALVNFFFREKDLIIEELEEEDINSIDLVDDLITSIEDKFIANLENIYKLLEEEKFNLIENFLEGKEDGDFFKKLDNLDSKLKELRDK